MLEFGPLSYIQVLVGGGSPAPPAMSAAGFEERLGSLGAGAGEGEWSSAGPPCTPLLRAAALWAAAPLPSVCSAAGEARAAGGRGRGAAESPLAPGPGGGRPPSRPGGALWVTWAVRLWLCRLWSGDPFLPPPPTPLLPPSSTSAGGPLILGSSAVLQPQPLSQRSSGRGRETH